MCTFEIINLKYQEYEEVTLLALCPKCLCTAVMEWLFNNNKIKIWREVLLSLILYIKKTKNVHHHLQSVGQQNMTNTVTFDNLGPVPCSLLLSYVSIKCHPPTYMTWGLTSVLNFFLIKQNWFWNLLFHPWWQSSSSLLLANGYVSCCVNATCGLMK